LTRKLHIGGQEALPGWEIFDVQPGPYVDHIGNANDLSRFSDCSFDEIYASHVLEHFDYKDELILTLKEWNRVLKPLGRLYVSVPDISILAGFLSAKDQLTLAERFHVMRMLFGGHVDAHDYHLVGFDEEILRHFLKAANFGGIKKTADFGLFQDTSCLIFKEERISLNLIARKIDVS
jgi:predicted SAM-dependent methyltransferase